MTCTNKKIYIFTDNYLDNQREEAPAKTEPAPTYTKEDVRGVLAAKSAAGFKKEVKDLLEKFGAQQLKQIDPKDYAALLKEAEVIGNA